MSIVRQLLAPKEKATCCKHSLRVRKILLFFFLVDFDQEQLSEAGLRDLLTSIKPVTLQIQWSGVHDHSKHLKFFVVEPCFFLGGTFSILN